MKKYVRLIRPKDWAKNLFLFVPIFFAGRLFQSSVIIGLLEGFICFSLIASSIYIVNDFKDIEEDKKHPQKKNRPMASGSVKPVFGLSIAILLFTIGILGAWYIGYKFLFVIGIYFSLNLGYSFGLKNIPILDIIIISIGFVLRVKAGAVIAGIGLSEWLTIMVFLLALFMAIGKRRDDVILKSVSGTDMRKSVKGYNLEFINSALSLTSAVIIVAYIMYSTSPEVQARLHTYRLYYTSLFVMAGLFRYMQLIFVQQDSQSPTNILYKDRFIQVTILLWIMSFYLILYVKDISVFK